MSLFALRKEVNDQHQLVLKSQAKFNNDIDSLKTKVNDTITSPEMLAAGFATGLASGWLIKPSKKQTLTGSRQSNAQNVTDNVLKKTIMPFLSSKLFVAATSIAMSKLNQKIADSKQ